MADYSKGAVWEVRKLLWAELQAAGILTASDYRENNVSYIPIIPVQEQERDYNKELQQNEAMLKKIEQMQQSLNSRVQQSVPTRKSKGFSLFF